MVAAQYLNQSMGNLSNPDVSRGLNSSRDYEGRVYLGRSRIYREFLEEREEILRHKWIEREKKGYDIGFERALVDWVMKHRAGWRESRTRLKTLEAAVQGGVR